MDMIIFVRVLPPPGCGEREPELGVPTRDHARPQSPLRCLRIASAGIELRRPVPPPPSVQGLRVRHGLFHYFLNTPRFRPLLQISPPWPRYSFLCNKTPSMLHICSNTPLDDEGSAKGSGRPPLIFVYILHHLFYMDFGGWLNVAMSRLCLGHLLAAHATPHFLNTVPIPNHRMQI